MMEEKRMAGDYEVIHSIHIGDKEIVIGENPSDKSGQMYMCAYCTDVLGLYARYDEIEAGSSYPEIVKLYGERITEQAEKAMQQLMADRADTDDYTAITEKGCTPINSGDDLNGKIVVIKPEVLRREYRAANYQLKLCTGGFGASPNARGSACFCIDLHSGKESRFERHDILGTMEPEQLPPWAEKGLEAITQVEKSKGAKIKEER